MNNPLLTVLMGYCYRKECTLRKLPTEILQLIIKLSAAEVLDEKYRHRWMYHIAWLKENKGMKRRYDEKRLGVTSVTFWISRGFDYSHTIHFINPVTEQAAVKRAELYLSQPLTEEYYERVRDDCDMGAVLDDFSYLGWLEKRGDTRGSCLGNAHSLYICDTGLCGGHLTLTCPWT